jgi:hypothetical protein
VLVEGWQQHRSTQQKTRLVAVEQLLQPMGRLANWLTALRRGSSL